MASFLRRALRFKCYSYSSSSETSSVRISVVEKNRFKSHPLAMKMRSASTVAKDVARFDEMVAARERKFYMLGGKGGVGKTSCAASLALKFADHGHNTIIVSTDPAHSLSDSFALDLTGGKLVAVEGTDSRLYALEINPEKAKEDFRDASRKDDGKGVKNFMDSMGLGMLGDQFGDLNLGELLENPPPGMDEAIAVSKLIEFLESKEYQGFTRIVFDTAPTGHTLRLLSLPDFLDSSVGKIIKMKQKIASATSSFKNMLRQGKEEPQEQETKSDKLEQLRERMTKVRDLIRNADTTEFIIVTIPTVMAVSESSRLHACLKKEHISVRRLVVNQFLPSSTFDCKFCTIRRKDQMRAIDMIQKDSGLASLMLIESPLIDAEIRGVPALKFMGDKIWK